MGHPQELGRNETLGWATGSHLQAFKESAEIASAAGALDAAAFGPMEGDISPEAVRAVRERRRAT